MPCQTACHFDYQSMHNCNLCVNRNITFTLDLIGFDRIVGHRLEVTLVRFGMMFS